MARIDVKTSRKVEFIDVSAKIEEEVRKAGIEDGLCLAYVPHTTAGILINENADPSVAEDIIAALDRSVPENLSYRHLEGNSPAHIKASLTGSSKMIIVESGRLKLGTWQGIFFCEFDGPRGRQLWVKLIESR
ncbi:secondary thiamine-phosphate synthase enzyme YjbQ [Acidobacteriota bacterium]